VRQQKERGKEREGRGSKKKRILVPSFIEIHPPSTEISRLAVDMKLFIHIHIHIHRFSVDIHGYIHIHRLQMPSSIGLYVDM